MRLGCCASIEKAEVVKQAGFDFIECTVTSLIPNEDHSIFEQTILKRFQESPLPVEAFNVFIPGQMALVGDQVHWEALQHYLDRAFERMNLVGGKVVVFGSGGARNIPAGFDRQQAEKQIVEFLNAAADKADAAGMTVVIEPLNKKECNVINTVEEGVELVKKINRSSIQMLADFYHMDEEEESLSHLVAASPYLKHVHVADTGRLAPGTGQYPYHEFVARLREANYQGRVSIECNWNDFDNEAARARQFLHQIFS
ncbi:sugar phosphate isomerase/epimerase [Pullulanibacillus sp. KACC 23026]|uniref:sugar phosphate isomerase/epimerase family protein n=1 Tax=Pullulanibacillus sp. KACC 23026 TaxID=3028315 RepID=UPI0023AEF482|nr:sugar phosphate isomerase/epimerase family protein [Pullulanibacillus sp. KACC 23026]WEG13799.1 sugar phosphate isomerase/epimerase [Pullulanibacillus sp. KACC 23026]